MKTDGNAILVQAIYIAVAVGLTVWLARTLFRNGTAFLHDVFWDKCGYAIGSDMRRIEPYSIWIGHAGDGRNFRVLFDEGIRVIVQLALEELSVVWLSCGLAGCFG